MSPTVIIRQNGMLVDSNNQPIAGIIKELKKKINEAPKNSDEKYDLEEEPVLKIYVWITLDKHCLTKSEYFR